MDLMYMTSRKFSGKIQFYNDFMDIDEELKGLIRVSANNTIAWVTKYELNDSTDQSLGSRVYVADLNLPWNFHRVLTNDNTITLLEWDLCGECLMIGDDSGNLSIWSFKEYIFNDWICVGRVHLLGEHMIAGAFYHSGRKIVLNVEKRDTPHYYEKFTKARYKPTVQVRSGAALDGCLAVTSTGLVVACTISGDTNSPILTTTESISSIWYKISVVDIAYAPNGNLIIAASCGSVRMPIKCYEISIAYTNKKTCTISSHPLAGCFVDASKLKGNPQDWYISHIKFLFKDMTNSLIVVVNSRNGESVVQLWEFSADETTTASINHNMYNESAPSNDVLKTLNWKCTAHYEADSAIECISTPKMLMYNNSNAPCYVILVCKNNRIKALSRSLREELQFNLSNFWDMKDIKRIFNNISVADIDISWLANIVLVSDNVGNFYVVQVQNAELGGPLTVNHSVMMLEYCLVSGLDFWDVAMSLKPSMLETVCERLSENFNRQLSVVQQQEYGGFLSMKAFLYRLISNSAQKHSDLLSLLTLYSISVLFKSFLRPLDVNSYSDKSPGENLISVLLESSNLDISVPLTIIDPKEFAVDPTVSLSFQQLIQWVAHLALNILSRIPDHHKTNGYDIVNDNHALNILREVLVIINLWGFMKPQCLPIFMKNGNFNGLCTLYRHTTRLIQCNQNNEIDENFVDECYLLRNQVFFPTITLTALEINDVASSAFLQDQLPKQFIFGSEPESVVYEMETFTLDGSFQTIQNTDIIKHIYLGESNPHKMKQCNRCQGKTQVFNATKSWAIRSWEDRWIRSCLCGGRWRFIKTGKSPYSTKKI